MEKDWQIIKKPHGSSGPFDPLVTHSTLGVKLKDGNGYLGAYAIIESPMTTQDENYIIEILQRNVVPLKDGTTPAPLFGW